MGPVVSSDRTTSRKGLRKMLGSTSARSEGDRDNQQSAKEEGRTPWFTHTSPAISRVIFKMSSTFWLGINTHLQENIDSTLSHWYTMVCNLNCQILFYNSKSFSYYKKVILGITGEHNVLFKKKKRGGGALRLPQHLSDIEKTKESSIHGNPGPTQYHNPLRTARPKHRCLRHEHTLGKLGSTHWVCAGVFPEKRGRHLYCCYVLLAFSCSGHTQQSSSSDVGLYHQLWTNHSSTVVQKHVCAVFIEKTSWFLLRSKQALGLDLKNQSITCVRGGNVASINHKHVEIKAL